MNMKKTIITAGAALGLTIAAALAYAKPMLGAPTSGGDCASGSYQPYQINTTNPVDRQTAVTSGNVVCVSASYGNHRTLNVGGKYGNGPDWSAFGFPPVFDGKGPVVLAAVPDGNLATALTSLRVGGSGAFYTAQSITDLPPTHYQFLIKKTAENAGFLFFDLGDSFANIPAGALNFADPARSADGETKALSLAGMETLPWIHFDVMVLETMATGSAEKGGSDATSEGNDVGDGTGFTTTVKYNPSAYDVTWTPRPVPEPGALTLLGIGLLGVGFTYRWQRRSRERVAE